MALISYLLRRFKLGSPERITQFVFGFPILVRLPQAYVYPIADMVHSAHLRPPALVESVRDRFRARSSIQHTEALPVWTESLEQLDRVWLAHPSEIDPEGRLVKNHLWGLILFFDPLSPRATKFELSMA